VSIGRPQTNHKSKRAHQKLFCAPESLQNRHTVCSTGDCVSFPMKTFQLRLSNGKSHSRADCVRSLSPRGQRSSSRKDLSEKIFSPINRQKAPSSSSSIHLFHLFPPTATPPFFSSFLPKCRWNDYDYDYHQLSWCLSKKMFEQR